MRGLKLFNSSYQWFNTLHELHDLDARLIVVAADRRDVFLELGRQFGLVVLVGDLVVDVEYRPHVGAGEKAAELHDLRHVDEALEILAHLGWRTMINPSWFITLSISLVTFKRYLIIDDC